MSTPTVAVTVTLAAQDGTPYEGVTVRARLDANEVYEGIVISDQAEAVTDAAGVAILDVFPNAPSPTGLGTQGTTYRFYAAIPGGRALNVNARVPNTACRLENILVQDDVIPLDAAELAILQAQTAVTTAASSAASAASSAASASSSASVASAAATEATTAAEEAGDSADAANTSAVSAAASMTAAEAAAAEAQAYISPVSVADYTALRAYTAGATMLNVTGYLVTAAPSGIAGTFIRDDDDTTSADNGGTVILDAVGRRWKRVITDGIHVDWFGAKGIFTDDGPALNAAAAVVTEMGGATLVFRPGATYGVGSQVFSDPPTAAIYTYYPEFPSILEFANCERGVVVRGNGARIKCLDGAKYGTFETDGTPMASSAPYFGVGASTPYFYMIHAHGNASVHIENLELDGNLPNLEIGGFWGDTGRQLQATGMFLADNVGPVTVDNVITHHQGADGYIYSGPAEDATFTKENATFTSVRSFCNGRQGLSIVGGKGLSFYSCSFNYTGMVAEGSTIPADVSSSPGAGVDFESEAGKEVRDINFHNCEFIGNKGVSVLSDQAANVSRIHFYDSMFVGTVNYVLWMKRGGFRWSNCRVFGTCINFNSGSTPFNPRDAAIFEDTLFSNDATQSPTGTLYTVNDLLWENATGNVAAYRCTFEHHLGSITAGVGSTPSLSLGDGPHYYDCNFIAKAGLFGIYGKFHGRCWFIEDGGSVYTIPGSETPGTVISSPPAPRVSLRAGGPSYGEWYFRTGGVNTLYPATNDLATLDAIGIRTYASDADVTLTQGTDRRTQILSGTLTANRTITLSGGRMGSRFHITRTGGGAFSWDIGGLKTLTAARQWCEVEHNGTAWVVVQFGHLDALLSTNADVGNNAATLTVGTSPTTNIWNTTLTGDRAVTLSTTGAYRGARFRIIRTAAALGAARLTVGTGPLKSLLPGQWCDVEYDGSAWVLAGFGQLRDDGNLSADKGNLAATLTVGISEPVSVWNTPLTADRAVTLNTANAHNGATFLILRTASATGAFNLNVGTGPLIALAPARWCEVRWNGSAWVLSGYGSLEKEIVPSVSTDRGDADATLTVGTSSTTSVWNSPITADRAVTLSTTGAVNGSKFRVVRTAAATGAFNLNVGTGPIKALAAGQWCEVEYNGSAWTLTAYGTL